MENKRKRAINFEEMLKVLLQIVIGWFNAFGMSALIYTKSWSSCHNFIKKHIFSS